MANFGSFTLTNVGEVVEYKAQTGKELKFSKFMIGNGAYTGDKKVLTALVNPLMTCEIKRLNIQTETTNKKVAVGFNLNTADVETGFYLKEIGLFAKDPDTNQDVLIYYGNAGDTADYIAPSSGTTISEKLIDLEIYISNVNTITATIDSSLTYATLSDFENFKNNVSTYAPSTLETILLATNWTYNNSTQLYEYRINDNTITAYDIAIGNMDLANQSKLKDGYINTYNGYMIIYTSKNPTVDVGITITVWKTTDTVPPEYTADEIDEIIEEAFEEV